MEYSSYSPDLALNGFLLFSALTNHLQDAVSKPVPKCRKPSLSGYAAFTVIFLTLVSIDRYIDGRNASIIMVIM